MKFLIEAHHPAHIHFWKFPVRMLIERGHQVLMLARDRDVMMQLLKAYDWIPYRIPHRFGGKNNKLPLVEMTTRQLQMASAIARFNPNVVASLMGSYAQSAKLLSCPSVLFTDSEFQHFNHMIANPFADEIHTPNCFYKNLGPKQVRYDGIHELSYLGRQFSCDESVLKDYPGLERGRFVIIRLSAWNTFHDIHHHGTGTDIIKFINAIKDSWKIVISAEEDQLPDELRKYSLLTKPERFHDLLACAVFVLTEGATTASEAACLGIPVVYVNSTEPRGYLLMLEERYGLVKGYRNPKDGILASLSWISQMTPESYNRHREAREALLDQHCNMPEYIVKVLERAAK